MQRFPCLLVLIGVSLLSTSHATTFCGELSAAIAVKESSRLNPSRKPTTEESALITRTKIPILEFNDYAVGVDIIDIDNDGSKDVFAWSISGSGRFLSAQVYAFVGEGGVQSLQPRGSINLGTLQFPQFVRLSGSNYLVASISGDNTTTYVGKFAASNKGGLEMTTVCSMQTVLKPQSTCRHPACKTLVATIADKSRNEAFARIEWPHKYFGPAGAAIYFPEKPDEFDFDNTGQPTRVWRFGRKDYDYEHIYWGLIGQGGTKPEIDDALRPESESKLKKSVLPGEQHNRLRRTVTEQGVALGKALHRNMALPDEAQFFLFTANGNRTYWGWDIDDPPYGRSIHIAYTNSRKSDYIGTVNVDRSVELLPCESNCVEPLE